MFNRLDGKVATEDKHVKNVKYRFVADVQDTAATLSFTDCYFKEGEMHSLWVEHVSEVCRAREPRVLYIDNITDVVHRLYVANNSGTDTTGLTTEEKLTALSNNLTLLETNLGLIKSALEAKGVTFNDTDTLADYATYISNL